MFLKTIFHHYNILLVIGGISASVLMFSYALIYGHLHTNFWVFRCAPDGYSAEYYISYCADPAFGDFEHGAFFYEIEKKSIRNLKNAKVLFLGNSRAQFAFSTQSVDRYFKRKKLSYFMLAMGYDEMDVFPKRLIEKLDLRPDIIVINADYFFYNAASPIAKSVMAVTGDSAFEHRLKYWSQNLHERLCNASDTIIGKFLCRRGDAQFTIYKSRETGQIRIFHYTKDNKLPVAFTEKPPLQLLSQLEKNARKFSDFAKARGSCLILTVVPSQQASPVLGEKIAEKLDIPFILPDSMGLTSYDGSHMNKASAEKWSADFLARLDTIIEKCASR